MPETLLLTAGLALAAAIVLLPLRARAEAPATPDDAAAVRHRAALEALRDVEADHRAGSLDEEAYERELGVAEAHAAATRAALDGMELVFNLAGQVSHTDSMSDPVL